MIQSIRLMGVKVDSLTREEALQWIEQTLENRGNHPPKMIMTLNPARFLIAQEDPEYRKIINSSALVTNDGIGISLAAAVFRTPLKGRVTGADLVLEFAKLSARKGYKIFLIGAKKGVAERAAKKIESDFPGACVAGTYHGYFQDGSEEEKRALELIRQSQPDILITGFGAPRDEKWLKRNLKALGVPLGIGTGAGIDFAAGEVKRAPLWIRQIGCEWVYRLAKEPRRLGKRYLIGNAAFLSKVLGHKLGATGRHVRES